MRKWLARKLVDLATWLDWETVFIITMAREKPKKRGRPLGSKDKKPRKAYVRKVQP